MGLRFPNQKYGHCFFVTTSFHEHQPWGNIPGLYEDMAKSLVFCLEKYGARCIGYVFMPTHIHFLIAIDGNRLGDFMRDFKKYVAQKVIADHGILSSRVWQARYDRVAILSPDVLRIKLQYIHDNPVRARIATSAKDWLWSSAGAYMDGRETIVPIWREWG